MELSISKEEIDRLSEKFTEATGRAVPSDMWGRIKTISDNMMVEDEDDTMDAEAEELLLFAYLMMRECFLSERDSAAT